MYSLPAKGELSVPLFHQHGSRYENTYKYSFYGNSHPGNRAVKEHPKRVLTFTADSDLPAGRFRFWSKTVMVYSDWSVWDLSPRQLLTSRWPWLWGNPTPLRWRENAW